MPIILLIVGISLRRIKCRTSAAPCSRASAELSTAEAPTPTTATRFPLRASKSILSALCAQNFWGMLSTNPGMLGPPVPSRPVANTTFRQTTVPDSAPETFKLSRSPLGSR